MYNTRHYFTRCGKCRTPTQPRFLNKDGLCPECESEIEREQEEDEQHEDDL